MSFLRISDEGCAKGNPRKVVMLYTLHSVFVFCYELNQVAPKLIEVL